MAEVLKAVQQKSRKVTSTAPKQMKQFCALETQFKTPLTVTLARRVVVFEGMWTQCVLIICGLLQQYCSVQQFFFTVIGRQYTSYIYIPGTAIRLRIGTHVGRNWS